MEKLHFNFDTKDAISKPVHVGVVASGDLEVIFRPTDKETEVNIVTGSDGFKEVWGNVLKRFFDRYPIQANIEINDFGSTPGVVNLRLTQALEELKDEK
ncbi:MULTISPECIES: malonate decarboxylase subunit delta [Companilactobacillus]|jgi:malonate decarboxylase acyl carrier protein|uniref:Malonate decarboxylase acyl carrier protein n=4 Tax=Companilactobacillus TaxID=2767879 RepID=A0A0H4LSE9_9LACO|nr:MULTISPECIES: malonate decarboxylase subunit delta [Companilactobacillus]AKP03489.1 malonate decarboxylase subunit delta [Companilactobacillus farciminis]AKS51792.1 malonate decarboxylase subunit delta [Companilactobacillus farciminis]ATO45952.1 malonate decarboxylase acyl carrier protein [Companilactobacillus farciminis KCTC 3681 = DSM 20184]KRK62266.1 malonate decarboxylase subunit delta [Companilactobacillus farciminis KCTC 3681 = DSM 20184]KRK93586.1 malonate decarboxylase subunit delta